MLDVAEPMRARLLLSGSWERQKNAAAIADLALGITVDVACFFGLWCVGSSPDVDLVEGYQVWVGLRGGIETFTSRYHMNLVLASRQKRT